MKYKPLYKTIIPDENTDLANLNGIFEKIKATEVNNMILRKKYNLTAINKQLTTMAKDTFLIR